MQIYPQVKSENLPILPASRNFSQLIQILRRNNKCNSVELICSDIFYKPVSIKFSLKKIDLLLCFSCQRRRLLLTRSFSWVRQEISSFSLINRQHFWGCGGSLVVHQTVKPAVGGLNPASLQPAGTCHSLLGSQHGWHDNCRLASEGRQRQKSTKIPKK